MTKINEQRMLKYIYIFLCLIMISGLLSPSAHAGCTKETYAKMIKEYTALKKVVDRQYSQGKFVKNDLDKIYANFNMAYNEFIKVYKEALNDATVDESECDSISNLFYDLMKQIKTYLYDEVPLEGDPLLFLPTEKEPQASMPKETEPAASDLKPAAPMEKEPKSATPLEREPVPSAPKETEPTAALPKY